MHIFYATVFHAWFQNKLSLLFRWELSCVCAIHYHLLSTSYHCNYWQQHLEFMIKPTYLTSIIPKAERKKKTRLPYFVMSHWPNNPSVYFVKYTTLWHSALCGYQSLCKFFHCRTCHFKQPGFVQLDHYHSCLAYNKCSFLLFSFLSFSHSFYAIFFSLYLCLQFIVAYY